MNYYFIGGCEKCHGTVYVTVASRSTIHQQANVSVVYIADDACFNCGRPAYKEHAERAKEVFAAELKSRGLEIHTPQPRYSGPMPNRGRPRKRAA
ncbi:MAG: hypothetical protein HYY37_00755 [Candidatus Aenigmarchaeota archaeon]|nr:hypothetical protein [Candidatus Aenigmarchaeota archaeon]